MSACCSEIGCRRIEPIDFVLGDFTGQVYAVMTKRLVKDHGNGTATFAARQRHEVTESLRNFIRANPDWVRAQLDVQP